ncbi:MAG: succinate dehydrogenase [Myxococcaceae bacterium]
MIALATPTDAATPRRGAFMFARLGSLLSVLPLSVWVVIHLWNNLAAFEGAEAWQRAVTQHPHPIAEILTFTIVLLPLLIHAAWGIGRLFSARPNNHRYNLYGNFKYVLQRVTALGALAFLGAHLWLAFLKPRLLLGRPEAFSDIAHEMATHPPTLIVYLLGTFGICFHLANGLQTAAWQWGLVGSQKGINRLDRAVLVFFALLVIMSWAAIYALHSAGAASASP